IIEILETEEESYTFLFKNNDKYEIVDQIIVNGKELFNDKYVANEDVLRDLKESLQRASHPKTNDRRRRPQFPKLPQQSQSNQSSQSSQSSQQGQQRQFSQQGQRSQQGQLIQHGQQSQFNQPGQRSQRNRHRSNRSYSNAVVTRH